METARTTLISVGWLVAYGGLMIFDYPITFLTTGIGIVLTISGCYLWTQLKNRHWIFCLWGILTPIGLLGISLLKDKSETPDNKT
jgi:hypothetical protein